jgi:hypothetical protein
VENEHFFSDHLIRNRDLFITSQTLRYMMGDRLFLNMKLRNTTDLTEVAPPGCILDPAKPKWGSQTIYKNDYGPLRILKL